MGPGLFLLKSASGKMSPESSLSFNFEPHLLGGAPAVSGRTASRFFGSTTRGHGYSRLLPRGPGAAPLGRPVVPPGPGRAGLVPLQAGCSRAPGRGPEKAAYRKPARRGRQTGPRSSRPLPGRADRRRRGTASLAGRGRPRAPDLWGQSTQQSARHEGPLPAAQTRVRTPEGVSPRDQAHSPPPCLQGLGWGHSDAEHWPRAGGAREPESFSPPLLLSLLGR